MPKLPALPFVRTGVSEGLSANGAYRQYQAAAREQAELTGEVWQASRRQDFLRLFSQTMALRDVAARAVQAPKGQLPEPSLVKERSTVHATGYGTWVSIFQRTRGESDFLSMPYLIKSAQPLTPEEAEARALDYLSQQPDVYNRQTLGVTYVGTEQFLPDPNL